MSVEPPSAAPGSEITDDGPCLITDSAIPSPKKHARSLLGYEVIRGKAAKQSSILYEASARFWTAAARNELPLSVPFRNSP